MDSMIFSIDYDGNKILVGLYGLILQIDI